MNCRVEFNRGHAAIHVSIVKSYAATWPHFKLQRRETVLKPTNSRNFCYEPSLPIQRTKDRNHSFFNGSKRVSKRESMMNVLALGLVLTSLVTAGFFSPSQNHIPKEDVIVKEGHRVVVVEFEKGDGNTKVSISPHDTQPAHKVDDKGYVSNAADKLSAKMSERMEDAKEKVKDGSSSFIPESQEAEETRRRFSPRELVCDAYGKCKHKIASAIGKTKELVTDKAQEMEEEGEEAVGKAKDSVIETVHKASDKAHETKESLKDASNDVSSRAKDKIAEKAGEMKQGAKEQAERAKGKVSDVIDSTKKLKEEVESEGRRKMEGVKEMVREKAVEAGEMMEDASDRVKQGASEVKKEAKKELSEIMRHAREVMSDAFRYVVSLLTVIMDSVTGILHLMGFSAAYGMCLWITFASSYVLAGALPRHQFAMVQSKIYPVYFKAMACSVGIAMLGHLMGSKRFSLFSVGAFQGFNLLASLGMILVNLLYLEPRATKVLFERMKKEKEEGTSKESHLTDSRTGVRAVDSLGETAGRVTTAASQDKAKEAEAAKSEILRLSEILKRLNSYSSFLNVLTLMSLTGHLVHLGQRMHIAC